MEEIWLTTEDEEVRKERVLGGKWVFGADSYQKMALLLGLELLVFLTISLLLGLSDDTEDEGEPYYFYE